MGGINNITIYDRLQAPKVLAGEYVLGLRVQLREQRASLVTVCRRPDRVGIRRSQLDFDHAHLHVRTRLPCWGNTSGRGTLSL